MGALDGGSLVGKVAIVTGAGQGLGRCHAELLAAEGASVVVNDLGEAADATAAAIVAAGGTAVAHRCDVTDWQAAEDMVGAAVDTFGDLHILVNNAGFVRDAMSFSMTEEQFDSVVAVHLKGHFAPSRAAGSCGVMRPRPPVTAPNCRPVASSPPPAKRSVRRSGPGQLRQRQRRHHHHDADFGP